MERITTGPWGNHNCALLSTGEVRCWGINIYGQLGDGTEENRLVPVPVVGLPEEETIADISASGRHTCVLPESSMIMCWGMDYYGQLGDGVAGSGRRSLTPVRMTYMPDGWKLVSAGTYHTCGTGATSFYR